MHDSGRNRSSDRDRISNCCLWYHGSKRWLKLTWEYSRGGEYYLPPSTSKGFLTWKQDRLKLKSFQEGSFFRFRPSPPLLRSWRKKWGQGQDWSISQFFPASKASSWSENLPDFFGLLPSSKTQMVTKNNWTGTILVTILEFENVEPYPSFCRGKSVQILGLASHLSHHRALFVYVTLNKHEGRRCTPRHPRIGTLHSYTKILLQAFKRQFRGKYSPPLFQSLR